MDENIQRREYSSQSSHIAQMTSASSQWIDQPRPSGGYICFCLFFPLLLLLILGTTLIRTYFVIEAPSIIAEGVTFALLFVGFVVIFGLILRMGYTIKYVLDGHTLHLYAGKRVAFSIPLYQISQMRKTTYNRRLMGWGIGNAGLCNRFRNGICLTVTKGRRSYELYISPSDPDDFLTHLNNLKE